MSNPVFSASTIDDVMRLVVEAIQSEGKLITPTQGPCKELTGVLLELTNPRARLSRTETRGKPFSCLGELCWYLAKTNKLDFISYYISRYTDWADGDVVIGGYGPRLFDWNGIDQLANVTALLRRNPSSRRAVIQLVDATDVAKQHKSVPCTCTLQFMIRRDTLEMLTFMRSNDAFLGLPHDFFCFTMIQEIIARTLSIEVGIYKHVVGSLHLYEKHKLAAQRFVDEGWQSTELPMPAMPDGDPWPAIELLLAAEAAIRTGGTFDWSGLQAVAPYWADLVRLLQIFRYRRDRVPEKIREVGKRMFSNVYKPFIERAADNAIVSGVDELRSLEP